jgi:hypothetical protein
MSRNLSHCLRVARVLAVDGGPALHGWTGADMSVLPISNAMWVIWACHKAEGFAAPLCRRDDLARCSRFPICE